MASVSSLSVEVAEKTELLKLIIEVDDELIQEGAEPKLLFGI
ncbi:MAG: hypothetical protein RIM23_07370 [Coleofasciculus sp. G3-WIS-01]